MDIFVKQTVFNFHSSNVFYFISIFLNEGTVKIKLTSTTARIQATTQEIKPTEEGTTDNYETSNSENIMTSIDDTYSTRYVNPTTSYHDLSSTLESFFLSSTKMESFEQTTNVGARFEEHLTTVEVNLS